MTERHYRNEIMAMLYEVGINDIAFCRDFPLLIYETKSIAERCARAGGDSATASLAEYWSRETRTKVTYCLPGSPIFVLEKSDEFWKVIIGERVGWIIVRKQNPFRIGRLGRGK